MANVGLSSFLYAKLTEVAAEGAIPASHSFGAVGKLSGAIECKVAFNINDGALYSNNVLKYSNYNVTGANITLGIDDDSDAIFGPLLGQTKKTVTLGPGETPLTVEQYEIGSADDGGYYGFAYIESRADGTYEARVFRKVKFKPFIGDSKTQAEKLEYTTPSVEGVASYLEDGTKMEAHANCTSMTDAVTYINKVFAEVAA